MKSVGIVVREIREFVITGWKEGQRGQGGLMRFRLYSVNCVSDRMSQMTRGKGNTYVYNLEEVGQYEDGQVWHDSIMYFVIVYRDLHIMHSVSKGWKKIHLFYSWWGIKMSTECPWFTLEGPRIEFSERSFWLTSPRLCHTRPMSGFLGLYLEARPSPTSYPYTSLYPFSVWAKDDYGLQFNWTRTSSIVKC